MGKINSYCEAVSKMDDHDLHKIYHDTMYGFRLSSDDELFERLILEINQAGLSWTTILKKVEGFQKAYDKFHISKVASYSTSDKARLMSDASIIRNRLKIDAAIHNANIIMGIQKSHGSFLAWLDENRGKSREEWTKLFKKTFRFTGGEIVNEFLMSTAYLPGAHSQDCPIFKKHQKQLHK